ncbi:MAG: hypothetical protein K2Q10_14855, partial [Rhodospirillales bacterium]|nr:hypothetical protein [Rhodospirillales bacterium]
MDATAHALPDNQTLIADQKLRIEKLTRDLYGPCAKQAVWLIDQMELQFEELSAAMRAAGPLPVAVPLDVTHYINLTGAYLWGVDRHAAPAGFRPLRTPSKGRLMPPCWPTMPREAFS